MQRVVLEQRLGFAATVCSDRSPNLSPKGTTTVWDDGHLLFADIHSPQTVRNLESNPAIEINVVDPIVRKGFRFKGRAKLHREGALYEQGLRLLAERGYDAAPERIRTIVRIAVESAAPLVSPVYDSGTSEERVVAQWARRLGDLHGWEIRPGASPAGAADEDAHARLVRRFHELQGAFYSGGPIEPLIDLLADDVRWHVPGSSPIAGDHQGRDAVLAYFRRRRDLARATFRLEVRAIVVAGDLVLQRVDGSVTRGGRSQRWKTAGVLRIHDGRIRECWLLPFDQALFDEIWSSVGGDRDRAR
jgi:uncharacterized protein